MPQNAHESPELSSRLKKTNEDLERLQSSVKTGMINVKVLMEFRNAAQPGEKLVLGDGGRRWIVGGDGDVHASVVLA